MESLRVGTTAQAEDKEEFVRLLWYYEEFREVCIINYCVMSNHIHVLVEVPQRPSQMPMMRNCWAKLKRLYSPEAFTQSRWQFANRRRLGANEEVKALNESLCD